ncbi:MAG: SDR family NAD(P)-dependent oxidoreductase, partial [Actinomycetota bacterium]|nr:SDR family NAD(P)-dependent oxidoreductase [Actinomycetota bacterium]
MMPWSSSETPDQSGRTFVITGSNSGIGLEAAKVLSRKGAHVVMACRNLEKAQQARAEVGGTAEVRHLDTASLESVHAFADGLDGEVDVLVNNAGIMAVPQARTTDGFESQLGTNFLGHFALTGLLLPRVTDRVVTLSSGAHRMGRINLEDPNWENRRYRRWSAYGQSKLADLMFAYELQRRLLLAGSSVRSIAAHPGYAATNLQASMGRAA